MIFFLLKSDFRFVTLAKIGKFVNKSPGKSIIESIYYVYIVSSYTQSNVPTCFPKDQKSWMQDDNLKETEVLIEIVNE